MAINNPVVIDLIQEIESKRKSLYEKRQSPPPRRAHWPSDISSCSRQMVYKRIYWDKLPAFDIYLHEDLILLL